MLGRKDLTKSVSEDGSVRYREEFCGACGVLHCRPELLHIYTRCSCMSPSTRSVLSLTLSLTPTCPVAARAATMSFESQSSYGNCMKVQLVKFLFNIYVCTHLHRPHAQEWIRASL